MTEMTGAPVSSLVAHSDGDVVQVGSIPVRLLHTPGHTPGSQCILAGDNLVSGDTLFIDGCGRTDLPGADPGRDVLEPATLGQPAWRLVLWPGHHYSPALSSPLETVRRANSVLARMSRQEWLRLYT